MVFRYYRGLLSEKEQAVYDILLNGFESYTKKIVIPFINNSALSIIFRSVLNDNPMLYYVQSFKLNNSLRGILSGKREMFPVYLYHIDEIKHLNRQCEAIINRIKEYCIQMDDYSKEEVVHDLFCKKINYNAGDFETHSVIGALLNKRAACDGISKAVKLLFDNLGLKSCVASGNSLQNSKRTSHQWNKVFINGIWSNLDITFDISSSKCGIIRYDYFNNSDLEFGIDHIQDNTLYPACDSNFESYYEKKGYAIQSIEELKILLLNFTNQRKNALTIKLQWTDSSAASMIIDKVMNEIFDGIFTTYSNEKKPIVTIIQYLKNERRE